MRLSGKRGSFELPGDATFELFFALLSRETRSSFSSNLAEWMTHKLFEGDTRRGEKKMRTVVSIRGLQEIDLHSRMADHPELTKMMKQGRMGCLSLVTGHCS